MMVIGLGADGDSKVRKYYVETFKKGHGERNDVIIIDNESFQFNSVVEDLREMDVAKPIPTLMFPDWRHLIKKMEKSDSQRETRSGSWKRCYPNRTFNEDI